MTNRESASLELLRRQRSHLLFVLSEARRDQEPGFLGWYQGAYRRAVLAQAGVLSVQQYRRHAVDITQGHYAPLPFNYLGLYEISVDGAPSAAGLIEQIARLHRQEASAEAPATWLYYPVSEKVGRSPSPLPSMLTLAFANGLPGQDAEFREWYATRHIRHALNIEALVSGQCFERTQFQLPGAREAAFSTIALYEQEGTPEDIIASFASIPEETFHFPMMDAVNFAEWVYEPLQPLNRKGL